MSCAAPCPAPALAASRLFLALWPPAPVRAAISAMTASWLAGLPGRPQVAGDLHLTLHFLGRLDPETVERVVRLIRAWPRPSLQLTLCRYGRFSGAGVIWLGPEQAPAALALLRARLGAALAGAGCVLKSQSFRPHVTLARAVRQPARLPEAGVIEWRADDLVLAGSLPARPGEVRYHVLARAGDGAGSGHSSRIHRSAGDGDL